MKLGILKPKTDMANCCHATIAWKGLSRSWMKMNLKTQSDAIEHVLRMALCE
jgi:hypothetical protein